MTNSTPSRNIDHIANHMALALRIMLDAYDVPRRCCIEAHEALDSYAKWKDDLQTQAFGGESYSGIPMRTEVVSVTAVQEQDLDITHVLDMEAQFEALSYDNQAVFGALHQHEEYLVDMALPGPGARAQDIEVEEVFDIVAEPLMTLDEFIEEPVESPSSAKTTTVEPAFTSVKRVNVKGLVKAKLKHLVGKVISVAAKVNGVFSAAAASTAVAWKTRPSVGSQLREGYRTVYEVLTAERDIVKPMRRAVRGLMTVSPTAAGSERNRLKRLWISFWYRDLTRFVMVLTPGHFLFTLPLAVKLGVEGDALRAFATFSYLGVLVWAVGDSDYSYNLGRIGLDAFHKPLYSSSSSNPANPQSA